MSNSSPSVLTEEVAGILRAARARRNVSQETLALAAEISQSQMSKMLRGLRPITIDQLDVLCEMLDLSLVDVIKEADEETEARSYDNPVVREHWGLGTNNEDKVVQLSSGGPSEGGSSLEAPWYEEASAAEPERRDVEGEEEPELP